MENQSIPLVEISSAKNYLTYELIDFIRILDFFDLTDGFGKWGLLSGDHRLRIPLIAKLAAEQVYERKNQIKRKT